ncbi:MULTISPECIES: phosphopantetheine-binding protein [Treponema]|uniref:Acyl carrier protein n=1 Tax=Treponema rectale TaxID=744512 RepID=A0A840SBT0_9SPIR|nr:MULTISPECIES: phosphopantetheine-binding protein [Treponema]MBB5218245.1 acyl carrier protein [Treponema rectale]MBE6355219.1 acyl carrier protein [Treponema sp.]MBO6177362.1 acyl carrier protein [Treponema sp.]QOS40052.1 acyl carrier protein [Treponema rectale]
MDELMDILKELKPDVDFENEKGLIDNAVLDSFDIVELINRLKETFDIDITPAEIVPENFNSAESLWAMVEKLQ